VLELRTPEIDKGNALHAGAEQLEARTIVLAGDDLGELAAFDAVDELPALGSEAPLICSACHAQARLAARSAVRLDAPPGVPARRPMNRTGSRPVRPSYWMGLTESPSGSAAWRFS